MSWIGLGIAVICDGQIVYVFVLIISTVLWIYSTCKVHTQTWKAGKTACKHRQFVKTMESYDVRIQSSDCLIVFYCVYRNSGQTEGITFNIITIRCHLLRTVI